MFSDATHRQLLDSIGVSPLAMVISNPTLPDNPLEAINAAFCTLTGYRESEIIGRNCRFLGGEATERWARAVIRDAIWREQSTLVEILNYRKDGSPFRNGVMITPLFDENGKLQYFLGSQVDLGNADALPARKMVAVAKVKLLSRRQKQILIEMSHGLLNKQIAHKLGIAEKTVKMHRALLLERIGASTSADAIRVAVEAGL